MISKPSSSIVPSSSYPFLLWTKIWDHGVDNSLICEAPFVFQKDSRTCPPLSSATRSSRVVRWPLGLPPRPTHCLYFLWLFRWVSEWVMFSDFGDSYRIYRACFFFSYFEQNVSRYWYSCCSRYSSQVWELGISVNGFISVVTSEYPRFPLVHKSTLVAS